MESIIPVTIFVLLLSSFIGVYIGDVRGRPGAGFFWGLVLGPAGWIIVIGGPDVKRQQNDAALGKKIDLLQSLMEAQMQELIELRSAALGKKAGGDIQTTAVEGSVGERILPQSETAAVQSQTIVANPENIGSDGKTFLVFLAIVFLIAGACALVAMAVK